MSVIKVTAIFHRVADELKNIGHDILIDRLFAAKQEYGQIMFEKGKEMGRKEKEEELKNQLFNKMFNDYKT